MRKILLAGLVALSLNGCMQSHFMEEAMVEVRQESCEKSYSMFKYKFEQLDYAKDYYPNLVPTYKRHVKIAARNVIRDCEGARVITQATANYIAQIAKGK